MVNTAPGERLPLLPARIARIRIAQVVAARATWTVKVVIPSMRVTFESGLRVLSPLVVGSAAVPAK